MKFTSVTTPPSDESSVRIRAFFREIEKKARLSGNATLLMALDGVPDLLISPGGEVPDGAVDRANAAAIDELERITNSMSLGD